MANFEKVTKQITTEDALINEMKSFMIKSGLFSFVEEEKDSSRTVFTMKHKDGKYFTFAIGKVAYRTSAGQTNIWTKMFVNKPTIDSQNVLGGSENNDLAGMIRCRNCANSVISLPVVNMYMVNTGSFVIFVFEVSRGVYVHHAVGKYETYGDVSGGETAGGTQFALNNNIRTSDNGNISLPSDTTHPFLTGTGGSYARNGDIQYAGSHIILNSEYVVVSAYYEYNSEASNSNTPLRTYKRVSDSTYPFVNKGTNRFNGRTPMYPLNWYAAFPTSDIPQPAIPLFYTNEICMISINGIEDASIVDNKWLCFPLIARTGTGDYTMTGNVGIAYKIK